MTTLLLTADAILTMNQDNLIIPRGAIVIEKDKIVATGKQIDILPQTKDLPRKDFGRSLLMPGLINSHCHSGFLRGTAEGLPLWDWLRLYIDPMHRVLKPQDAEIASWLCYGESLLAGTTTVVDMWRFMEGSAKAAAQLGLRVIMVPYVGEAEGFDYFDTLDDNEILIKNYHNSSEGRIKVWVGVEHQFYFTEEACHRAVKMCEKYSTGLHTHSNESKVEIPETLKRHGLLPIQALEKLRLLTPETVLLAHCVWLDKKEIELLQNYQIGVAHNPTSNMKLASGAAPVEDLIKAGIAVGIGSDGEKENNNLDIFEEMKITSLLAKYRAMKADSLNSWDILRSATIEGARALGLDEQLGSLEVGKKADIIALRCDTARMTPFISEGEFTNIHHNIVHSAQGGDVIMTMVNGKILTENGILLTGSMSDFIERATMTCLEVIERRKLWLSEHKKGAYSPV